MMLSGVLDGLPGYNSYQVFEMEVETLCERVEECMDDLGLLLDQLFRFPQRQREAYFDKIHALKNRLLQLKAVLREQPPATSEKQYKQLYLAMNALKNDINLQAAALTQTKQNREAHNRTREAKEAKRSAEEACRLLREREEELRATRLQLSEKETVIGLQISQLGRLQQQAGMLLEQNRRLKFEQTSLQIELDSIRAAMDRSCDSSLQFRIREQEKDRAFACAVEQLQRLKAQLLLAREQVARFEQLAEVGIRKTRQVQENIKKVEREAQDLNDNCRIREQREQDLRRIREIEELEYQRAAQADINRQLELQNRRLKEDVQVIENELAKTARNAQELRMQAAEERERVQAELKRLMSELEAGGAREAELRRMLEESQKKQLALIAKLNAAEELRVRNQELESKADALEERLRRGEQLLDEARKEALHSFREKERANEQLEAQARAFRQLQLDGLRQREKLKLREQERARLTQEIEAYQCRLRENERAIALQEVAKESLQAQMAEQRSKVARIEQRQRVKEKTIEGLKVKLLQAKIQTVHEIREVINA